MSHANHPNGVALCGELTEFCDELRGFAFLGTLSGRFVVREKRPGEVTQSRRNAEGPQVLSINLPA